MVHSPSAVVMASSTSIAGQEGGCVAPNKHCLWTDCALQSFFVCSASVHLEDGAVEYLIFNPNLLCLVGTAVTYGRAHMWQVNEEGQLTLFPQPEDEPAFPDGLPKQVVRQEIVRRSLILRGITDWLFSRLTVMGMGTIFLSSLQPNMERLTSTDGPLANLTYSTLSNLHFLHRKSMTLLRSSSQSPNSYSPLWSFSPSSPSTFTSWSSTSRLCSMNHPCTLIDWCRLPDFYAVTTSSMWFFLHSHPTYLNSHHFTTVHTR